MLTQLATLKARLAIAPADITHDELLTRAIAAVSRRFDLECRREFARNVNAQTEFPACDTAVPLACLPLEKVIRFEMKTTENSGWLPQAPDYLVRQNAVISLVAPLGSARQLARVTYAGGYLLPGEPDPEPAPGITATRLPADVEHAAVEQVAAWFQNRDRLGLVRHWPSEGTYTVLSQQPLLPQVAAILRRYESWQW